jgi:TM2 domain-containing membrane protein YozV
MFCSGCGTAVNPGESFCPKCGKSQAVTSIVTNTGGGAGAVMAPQVIVVKEEKSPGIAAVLSFLFAGLGQIYNGQIGKGIVFICAYFVSVLCMFVLIGFVTTPILWIWGMIDAYGTAERINQKQRAN